MDSPVATSALGTCVLLGLVFSIRWLIISIPPSPPLPPSRFSVRQYIPPPLLGSTHRCRVCSEPTERRCPKCNLVFYCTTKHKKQDRLAHEECCIRGVIVQGILLPVDEDHPRVIDVACTITQPYGWLQSLDIPDVREYVGDAVHGWHGTCTITDHGSIKCSLNDHGFIYVYRRTFREDGSPVNQCVQHLTGDQAAYKWSGPIVVLKERCNSASSWPFVRHTGRYEDLRMEDFMRHAVKYLTTHDPEQTIALMS